MLTLEQLDERIAMLEKQYVRLVDDVKENNQMTARMYGVFQEMEPGFKFFSDAYSVAKRAWQWLYVFTKWTASIVVFGYLVYTLATTGKITVGL